LEELPEQAKLSLVKPFVNYRHLPVAMQWSPELIMVQLEILEDEGRVELKRLDEECAVRLKPLGWKSLEVSEDEWQRRILPSVANTTERSVRQSIVDSGDPTTVQSHHPKAFVSHATTDHPFVEKFAADLRANNVDAWFSKWEIKPGDSIRAKIEEGLEGCEYFIIVLSKSSITRPWVQKELDAATVRNIGGKVRKIIPIKIGDCGDLPPTLGSLCWEDFSNQPYEAALKRVLDSIFERDVRPPLGTVEAGAKAVLPMIPQHLPDRRPRVIATGYGAQTGTSEEGVFLLNEGSEVAHRVCILPIGLGPGWTLQFAGDLTILKEDGFIAGIVTHGHEHNLSLDFAWRKLQGQENTSAVFPLIIIYADFEGRHYRSVCVLYRDGKKESGFSIAFQRQEREDGQT
jgi:hypothetical protein